MLLRDLIRPPSNEVTNAQRGRCFTVMSLWLSANLLTTSANEITLSLLPSLLRLELRPARTIVNSEIGH